MVGACALGAHGVLESALGDGDRLGGIVGNRSDAIPLRMISGWVGPGPDPRGPIRTSASPGAHFGSRSWVVTQGSGKVGSDRV